MERLDGGRISDASEDERVAMMYEENGHYLEDERLNLDIQLSQPHSGCLPIWGFGMAGARDTKKFPAAISATALYSDYDYTTWYVDKNRNLSVR